MAPRSPVWHPYTQHALQPEAMLMAEAEGAWLTAADGRRILDGISSWWVVTHGHRNPRIVAAVMEQADKLDQVIFAGFTHEPAERLASQLVEFAARYLPSETAPLSHVFFSDSGSTSVEVALKMALGYWRNKGEARFRVLALEHAYHGDTIGTMSAGARGVFNAAYEPLLFDVERIPFPHPGTEQVTIDALVQACQRGTAAALIVEPLVLGAGGMLMYSAAVLAEMRKITAHYRTLLIADEVMTGFGRTGTALATTQAGITPDLLCLAKGLTGGTLPLAVTLSNEAIFEAHLSPDRSKTFFHSSSYTANPICCAAGVANMQIWADEPVEQRISSLSAEQARRIAAFEDDARFTKVRHLGTITALDVSVRDTGYLAGIGPKLYASFIERGILLRPLGNTIYVMPPYCTAPAELDLVYGAIGEAADIMA